MRGIWRASVVGLSVLAFASCGDPVDDEAAAPVPKGPCDVIRARPPIGEDTYLLQIADRAEDPAEATEMARDDPEAALNRRRDTLTTLRDAGELVGDDEALRSHFDEVIAAYEQNIAGLEALVQSGSGFLPVGAGLDDVKTRPSRSRLRDHLRDAVVAIGRPSGPEAPTAVHADGVRPAELMSFDACFGSD